jgi:hypothetical protein
MTDETRLSEIVRAATAFVGACDGYSTGKDQEVAFRDWLQATGAVIYSRLGNISAARIVAQFAPILDKIAALEAENERLREPSLVAGEVICSAVMPDPEGDTDEHGH